MRRCGDVVTQMPSMVDYLVRRTLLNKVFTFANVLPVLRNFGVKLHLGPQVLVLPPIALLRLTRRSPSPELRVLKVIILVTVVLVVVIYPCHGSEICYYASAVDDVQNPYNSVTVLQD